MRPRTLVGCLVAHGHPTRDGANGELGGQQMRRDIKREQIVEVSARLHRGKLLWQIPILALREKISALAPPSKRGVAISSGHREISTGAHCRGGD